MKKYIGLILIILILSTNSYGQESSKKPFSVGLYFSEKAYGGYGEYLWTTVDWDFSFRLGALQAESDRKFEDMGWMGIGNFYAHVPTGYKWLSFHLGFGALYQTFEWKTALSSGTISDFTFNGGLGANFRITDFLGVGIEGWIISDYESSLDENLEPEKGSRYLRFVPTATISFFF